MPRTVQSKSSSITKIDEKFISAPLPNSFIHAAHGATNATESWGSPESISQQILANPQLPENSQKPADFGPRRNGPLRASRKAPQPPKKPVLCCEEQSFAEMHAQVCCQKMTTNFRNKKQGINYYLDWSSAGRAKTLIQ